LTLSPHVGSVILVPPFAISVTYFTPSGFLIPSFPQKRESRGSSGKLDSRPGVLSAGVIFLKG
jgi:hypothetical protein